MIIGPGGTGKTSTCMYLWKKLKDANIPYLVCFEQSFDPDFSPFYHYTRGFCKGNFLLCVLLYSKDSELLKPYLHHATIG